MDFNKNKGGVIIPTLGSTSLSTPEYGSYTSDGLSSLPVGYPTHMGPEFGWTGNDQELHFIYNITGEGLMEVRSAKDHFKCTHTSLLNQH